MFRSVALAAVTAAAMMFAAGPGVANDVSPQVDPLEELAEALIETDAVGMLDKLAIQSRVEALAKAFHYWHDGSSGLTLTDLRTRFETLHGEIVAMLAPEAPALAREVRSKQDALWQAFRDPKAFRASIGEELGPGDSQLADRMGM